MTFSNSQKRDGTDYAPERSGLFMQTFTGRAVYPLDLRPEDIEIKDIAHSLSLQCRYAGHCQRFYSVAEHSVLMARSLYNSNLSREIVLAGLMHDSPEAYLVDVPRPIKPSLTGYGDIEARVWAVIAERYGLAVELPAEVKAADNAILHDERAQNMAPCDKDWGLAGEPLGVNLEFWSPEGAENMFMWMFRQLQGGL